MADTKRTPRQFTARLCERCACSFVPTSGRQLYCQNPCKPAPYAPSTCTCCASTYVRDPRWDGGYCSILCRNYSRGGVLSKPLPADHWARWYGTTSEWKPASPAFQCGRCDDCGVNFVEPNDQTPSTYCSFSCGKRAARRRRRAREHNAPGTFRHSDIMRQYQRQGYACAYCKQPCDGLPDPEHVLALSRGGRNDMSNLVASCSLCNSDKGDMTLTEWAIDRVLRGRPAVRTVLSGPVFAHLWLQEPTSPTTRSAPNSALVVA